jgi:FkbM family methyltransferase
MNTDFIRQVGPLKWAARTALRQFYKRVLRRDHHLRLPSGHRFLLPIASRFASEAYITGGHVDWGSEELLLAMLDGTGVFLDVGANIGYYSAYVHHRVEKVYAFEPDPRNFPALSSNAASAGNVEILKLAVGSTAGSASFNLAHSPETSSLGPVQANTLEHGQTIEVQVITLDGFVSERGISAIAGIKIDVEGFDLEVVRGATNTLGRLRPVVLTEALPEPALFELLQGIGYDVHAYARSSGSGPAFFTTLHGMQDAKSLLTKMLFLCPQERTALLLQTAAGL